jgi:hypothetical protein
MVNHQYLSFLKINMDQIAFMCGQVIVDNPMELIRFKEAFALNPESLSKCKQLYFNNVLYSQNIIS